jgi:hypothetical protein
MDGRYGTRHVHLCNENPLQGAVAFVYKLDRECSASNRYSCLFNLTFSYFVFETLQALLLKTLIDIPPRKTRLLSPNISVFWDVTTCVCRCWGGTFCLRFPGGRVVLKMETAGSFETSVNIYHTTQRRIHIHALEDLKPFIFQLGIFMFFVFVSRRR